MHDSYVGLTQLLSPAEKAERMHQRERVESEVMQTTPDWCCGLCGFN